MAKAPLAQLRSDATAQTAEVIPFESATGQIGRLQVTVESIGPLLTHNPAAMGVSAEATKGSRAPDPEVEAEAGTYRLEDGTCAITGTAFRATLLAASMAYRVKKASLRIILAHITVVEELVALRRYDDTPIRDFVIDARRAVVQKNGIIRRRPRYNEWRATFTYEFDPGVIRGTTTIEQILTVLNEAGGRIGVGDFRPQKNGWFGRFRVVSYSLLEG